MPIYPELQDKVCHSAVLHSVHQTQGFGNWMSKKSITGGGTPQGRNLGSLGLDPFGRQGLPTAWLTPIGSTDRQRLLLSVAQRSMRELI
jgi:hypothetical protein